MKFFHCYSDELWDGYVKNGFLRYPFGIRFCQAIGLEESQKFNNLARIGGKLHGILKEHRCDFYVDRLQGGDYIENYQYDESLISEYQALLADGFLGFQMHEWLSNHVNDVHVKLGELPEEMWCAEEIEKEILRRYPFPYLFIESMTPEEMAAAGKPHSYSELYKNMTDIYKKRLKSHKKLLACDSGCIMYPFEARTGATVIMPEVGAQIPDMRLEMCFARGVCHAYGITLGAYYEPWGGEPFSACSYHEGDKNEWNIGGADFPFATAGENGGSSRSLQFRTYLYALISGAQMISEEWGGYNTFLSCDGYRLSEYGQVKLRFLEFADKYSDIGEKLSPVAAVMPSDLICYEISPKEDTLLGFPLEGEEKEKMRLLRRRVNEIFRLATETPGNKLETETFKNYIIPDAVDMLNDTDTGALDRFEYLIDLTGDAEFSTRHGNVIETDELQEVLERLLPVKVEGGLHHVINRRSGGGYYLTVFNHSGIERSVKGGEATLPDTERTVSVTLRDGGSLTHLEGDATLTEQAGTYSLTVAPGSFFFGSF